MSKKDTPGVDLSTADLVTLLNVVLEDQRRALLDELGQRGFGALTFPRLRLLWAIGQLQGSIVALARDVGLTKQVCGRQVKELARLGYAQIRGDRTDARAATVGLSAKGRAALQALRRAKLRRDRVMQQRLGARAAAQLRLTLLRLAVR